MLPLPSRPTPAVNLQDMTTLFLDMDGTLLDLNFDQVFWNEHLPRRYADIHGVESETAAAHVLGHLEEKQGTLNWYCTDFWSDTFQLDIMALKRELTHLVQFRPGTEKFLAHVRDSHHHVVLLTNAHPDVLALKEELTGLLSFIETSFTSHDFGSPKEHRAFWTSLAEHVDYDPETTVMIDDSLSVLAAARAHGPRYQVRITQPDSAREPVHPGEYLGVNTLDELLPGGTP